MAERSAKNLLPQHFHRVIEDFIPSETTTKAKVSLETIPIVSLEESVNSLVSLVPDIKQMVLNVKEKCSRPKDGLTTNESASIMLYSLEWTPREKSFYLILNDALRSEDEDKLKPWQLYLKLFLTALEKLPPISQTVYRGIKRNLTEQYPKDKIFVWWAFSSSTSSIEVLQSEQFLGKTGTRTLFNINCQSGKNIKNHSFFPNEDEILLIAGTKFQVASSLDSGNDLFIIQVNEIESDRPLLGNPPKQIGHHLSNTLLDFKSLEDSSRSDKSSSSHISKPPKFALPPMPGKPPRFPL